MAATLTAAPAVWRQCEARVREQREVGASHRWLELEVPKDFALPSPGQFVQLLLETPAPVLLPRPMSVAAAKRERGRLMLGFLYAPIGTGTQALAGLAAGSNLQLLGPLGHGFPLDVPGTPVLLAGGRGVAPLLFAADVLAQAGRRCEFLFGARSREQLVALAEARARLDAHGSRLHLCTDDGSRGARGHVVALLDRLAKSFAPPLVIHACGPHAMLAAAARWGHARHVPTFLAMESVMACGTGVCRGCPLPRSASGRAAFDPARTSSLFGNREYAMCCTEGPVFEAGDLDWERVT